MQVDLLDRWCGKELLEDGRLVYCAGRLIDLPVQLLRLGSDLDLNLVSF